MNTLRAWLIKARPPAERTDHIEIVDDDGQRIDRRPVVGMPGERGWNITLKVAGFHRVSDWEPDEIGNYVCTVEPEEIT